MSNSLRTPEDYELFLYNLIEQFPSVTRSTVIFIRVGATLARVAGELYFKGSSRTLVESKHGNVTFKYIEFSLVNL
jgi:hypothetical protein